MKKSIVAASVASVALAAMPIVGVFATGEATDELKVTVPGGCNVATRTTDYLVDFGTLNPGTTASETSTAISITCNKAWTVTPRADNLTGTTGTPISSAGNVKGSSFTLAITVSPTNADISNGYGTAQAIDGTTTIAGSAAVSSQGLTPVYSLTIGQQQEPDTYRGKVYYDIASN